MNSLICSSAQLKPGSSVITLWHWTTRVFFFWLCQFCWKRGRWVMQKTLLWLFCLHHPGSFHRDGKNVLLLLLAQSLVPTENPLLTAVDAGVCALLCFKLSTSWITANKDRCEIMSSAVASWSSTSQTSRSWGANLRPCRLSAAEKSLWKFFFSFWCVNGCVYVCV